MDGLEEGAAQALDEGTFDLVAQAVWIDDGAALEPGNGTEYFYVRAIVVGGEFDGGCYVTAFFGAAGDAVAAAFFGFAVGPTDLFCDGFEDGAETFVLQIAKAELEGIEVELLGEFVHHALAGEVVGGGC